MTTKQAIVMDYDSFHRLIEEFTAECYPAGGDHLMQQLTLGHLSLWLIKRRQDEQKATHSIAGIETDRADG